MFHRSTEHCQNGMVHLYNFPSNNYTELRAKEVLIRNGTYLEELVISILALLSYRSDEESEKKIAWREKLTNIFNFDYHITKNSQKRK